MSRAGSVATIAAGYGIVVALVGAVGTVALGTIGRVQSEASDAIDNHWRTIALAAEARDLSSLNARLTFSVFLMTNPEDVDEALRLRARNSESITAVLAKLERRLDGEVARQAYQEILVRRRAYVDSYLRALTLLEDGHQPEAARRVIARDTTPLLIAYQQAWQAFAASEGDKMDEAGRAALASYQRARGQLASLCVAAVGAAIVVALLTLRRLRAAEVSVATLNRDLEERVRAQTSALVVANQEAEVNLQEVVLTTTALQQSEARYRMLFEGSEDAMVTLEPPSWKVTSSNPAAKRLFGVADDSELDLLDLMPGHQPDGAASTQRGRAMVAVAMSHGSHYFEWVYRRSNGAEFPATVLLTRMRLGDSVILHATIRDISAEKSIQQSQRRIATAVANAAESVVITDLEGRIQYVNPAFERLSGYSLEEAVGKNPRVLKSGNQTDAVYATMWKTITSGKVWSGRLINRNKRGELYHEDVTISPVRDGELTVAYVAVKRDVTREVALEGQLAHEGKLAAVGQLAAGIAHEINTPTQFVSDSISFLSESSRALLELVDTYREFLAGPASDPRAAERIEEAEERADLAYLRENMPKAFDTSLDGLRRIATIVRAMKDFSHPGMSTKEPADLNQALESTLTIAANAYKYVAAVERDLGDIPPVTCNLADINQVFLNLVVNAAQAIGDVVGDSGNKGTISVRTRCDGDHVQISISDTGTGIPEEVRSRIFEPFFTTKPVGRGTGQGLAIARSIVVNKHGGMLSFTSQVGQGTTFTVRLPVGGAATAAGGGS